MSRRQPNPFASTPPWQVPACLAGGILYAFLFFSPATKRLDCLPAVLLPDEVVMSWVDGDSGRFALTDRFAVMLAACLLLAAGFVLGHLTLRAIGGDRGLSKLEIGVFSLGVGLSELSLMTLGLGLAGRLHQPWVFVSIFAVVLAVYVWQWRRSICQPTGNAKEPFADSPTGQSDRFAQYGLWLGLPFLLMIVFGGMMPPWDFDVREYHLQVPKEWFQSGRITFLPHNVYGNMPLGAEMHALLAMIFWPGELGWWWGAMAGKLVMAAFAPLTSLALLAAGRRLGQPVAGVAAAVVYLSIPWTVYIGVSGLNEGAVAFYVALAVYASLLWWESRSRPADAQTAHSQTARLLLAGFFAGSAVACKYPAVLFLVLPLGTWILLCRRRFDWKPAVVFGLAVACGGGPWLAKNTVFTGNPVYPLLSGGYTRTAERMEQWNRAHRVPPDVDGRRYSLKAARQAVAQVGWQSPWLSPLVLPLATLALAGSRWRKLAVLLAAFLIYGFAAWWLWTHRIDRFWVPLLPVLALLAGIGAANLRRDPWRPVVIGILIAGFAWSGLFLLTSNQFDRRYLVSLELLRSDVPSEPLGPSRVNPVHRWLNRTVPDGHCVLLVGDAQPFDLEVTALYNTCFDANVLEELVRDRTRDERLKALLDRKISHVYVQWSDIDRYRSPGNYGYTDYVTRQLIRDELVRRQHILRPIELGLDPERDQVFTVTGWEPPSPASGNARPVLPE